MWHILDMLQLQYSLTEQLTREILQSKCSTKSHEGVYEAVTELIDNGAAADGMPGGHYNICPIHAAAKVGNSQLITLLLSHGADVDSIDSLGRCPLHYAAESTTKAVSVLLHHKATPNICSPDMNSPLHWASYKNNYKSVQLLLKHGALVNAQNLNNDTPLSFASMRGNAESVQILLDYGANVDLENYIGRTAFMKICANYAGDIQFPGDELTYKLLKAASGQIQIKEGTLQHKYLQEHPELLGQFKALSSKMHSLTNLSRVAIRKHLVNKNIHAVLTQLRLPDHVIQYILLRDCL